LKLSEVSELRYINSNKYSDDWRRV